MSPSRTFLWPSSNRGHLPINALYQENAQADAPLVLSYTVGHDTHVITVDEAQHEYDKQQSISHAALRCVVALVRQLFTATGESP